VTLASVVVAETERAVMVVVASAVDPVATKLVAERLDVEAFVIFP
jgi:hypothetical protein